MPGQLTGQSANVRSRYSQGAAWGRERSNRRRRSTAALRSTPALRASMAAARQSAVTLIGTVVVSDRPSAATRDRPLSGGPTSSLRSRRRHRSRGSARTGVCKRTHKRAHSRRRRPNSHSGFAFRRLLASWPMAPNGLYPTPNIELGPVVGRARGTATGTGPSDRTRGAK